MRNTIFFVTLFLFVTFLLVLFEGGGIKGMVTDYYTAQGYVCEGNKCMQCSFENTPCFCRQTTCTCGEITIDKRLCSIKLLWQEIPLV